jgi:hypothetical protein
MKDGESGWGIRVGREGQDGGQGGGQGWGGGVRVGRDRQA